MLDACRKGELISILSLPLIGPAPLAGEERKKRGDDDAAFCCAALGVACGFPWGDDNTPEIGRICAGGAVGLLKGCWAFLVGRTGVEDVEVRFERREVGEDIIDVTTVERSKLYR